MQIKTFTHSTLLETVESIAVFSDCERFRYYLSRTWNPALPSLTFLMLNPSTATHERNDPTIERCEQRARKGRYGELRILNLFALRSTDPKALYSHPNPIGKHNNDHILKYTINTTLVCAWGQHGKLHNRGKEVERMLRDENRPLYYLKLGQNNTPSHPLYLPYNLMPLLWEL